MPTYTFRLPARFASTPVTVYNTADVQQTTGTTDSNAVFTASLPTGDYYAKISYGYTSYRAAGEVDRGDNDASSPEALAAAFAPPAWQDYTPVLTATTTNPNLGTGGTIAGRYVQNGTTVSGWVQIVFGTASTAAGSGAYEITLPVAMRAASLGNPAKHSIVGVSRLFDAGGTGTIIGEAFVIDGASTTKVRIATPTAAQVTEAAPFAWGASDRIYIEFTYEAAVSNSTASGPGADLASYARVAGAAMAPHIQLGPTTKTLHSGAGGTYPGVVAFQNDAPDAPDNATRVYIVPRAKPSTGVGGTLKIFGDPYFDGGDYRDFGLYHSADQNGGSGADTGQNATGVFWLNSKVNGTSYAGLNPDIGFGFQDGATVGGRFSYISSTQAVLVVGSAKPDAATKSTGIRAEIQGDLGFNGSARAVRWYSVAGTTLDNAVTLNTGDVTFTVQSAQRFKISTAGAELPDGRNLVVGTGTGTKIGTATTQKLGFYGVAPVAQPARPTDLATVITTLTALGLTA